MARPTTSHRVTAKSRSIKGTRRPLAFGDPIEWWQEEAARLGLTVKEYQAQIRLADSIMEELIWEDNNSFLPIG